MSAVTLNRKFSTAPMMDWSDRHCRYFWRKITQDSLLYTEMVTTGALLHGDRDKFLAFHQDEQPIALQLGGSNPSDLAACTGFAEEAGYNEVNLNVGCPSDRVQNNRIGACLMDSPDLVAECLAAMQRAVDIPVTVKHRIGINGYESYQDLSHFVKTIADVGITTFIVHARIAILEGLSPKENREIPPLKPDWVYQLKQDFPNLEIIINGGIKTHDECLQHLKFVDGVMIGREAYQNPSFMLAADQLYFDGAAKADDILARQQLVRSMYPYITQELSEGAVLHHITRHMLGLFNGMPGARAFRRFLSENANKKDANTDVLEHALNLISC